MEFSHTLAVELPLAATAALWAVTAAFGAAAVGFLAAAVVGVLSRGQLPTQSTDDGDGGGCGECRGGYCPPQKCKYGDRVVGFHDTDGDQKRTRG
jgi:hypothetical protein